MHTKSRDLNEYPSKPAMTSYVYFYMVVFWLAALLFAMQPGATPIAQGPIVEPTVTVRR
jgi:hypothetical protein